MAHSGYQSLSDEAQTIHIRIQTITGQAFNFSVKADMSVLELKQLLENTPGIGVAPVFQRLLWCGSELQDDVRLGEAKPTPVTDGSTIQIFLRPSPSVGLPAPPPPDHMIQAPAPYYYQPLDALTFPNDDAQQRVEKSALNIRLFGIFFVVMGLINGIVSATADISDWVNISIGGLLVILGGIGVHAGVTRSTAAARNYLIAIILFIMAFSGIFIASSVSSEDNTSDILVTVLVGIFFPIFLCSFCAFCAKRHLGFCQTRDELEVQLSRHIFPPHGLPVGVANVQPLLGAV